MVLFTPVMAAGRKPVGVALVFVGMLVAYTYFAPKDTCMGSCFSTTGLQEGSICEAATATCSGKTFEKLTCHNPTTCLDSKITCAAWDVCSCCSAEPLYKCLLPTAAKSFAPECSSPIDARQQCCGDAVTHERTTDIEEAIKAAAKVTQEEALKAAAKVDQFIDEADLEEKVAAAKVAAAEGIKNLEEFTAANHNGCADLNMLTEKQKAACAEQLRK